MWEALLPFFEWSYDTGIAVAIRESTWAFAILEVIHLLGLTVLLGAIFVASLRFAGLALAGQPVSQVMRDIRPWLVGGLITMVSTGALLFASEAMKCYDSEPFRWKMYFLFASLIFHFTFFRSLGNRDDSRFNPLMGKLTAVAAMVLWFGTGVFGRAIGFF
jgi:hypothetical protein